MVCEIIRKTNKKMIYVKIKLFQQKKYINYKLKMKKQMINTEISKLMINKKDMIKILMKKIYMIKIHLINNKLMIK